jgi:hypothetical protein
MADQDKKPKSIDDIVGPIKRKEKAKDNVKAHGKIISQDTQEELLNDSATPALDHAYEEFRSGIDLKNDDTIGKKADELYGHLNRYMITAIKSLSPDYLEHVIDHIDSLGGKRKHQQLIQHYAEIVGEEAAKELAGYAEAVEQRGGIKVRSLKARLRKHKKDHPKTVVDTVHKKSRSTHISHLRPGEYNKALFDIMGKDYQLIKDKDADWHLLGHGQLEQVHSSYVSGMLNDKLAKEYHLKRKKPEEEDK